MSYIQSTVMGVGTHVDGSKFSYPINRYTKLFHAKGGRLLLEQDNTSNGVDTKLYLADKNGNKYSLLRRKTNLGSNITKWRYSRNGEELSSLMFPKNGHGEVSLLVKNGKDSASAFYGHMLENKMFHVGQFKFPAACIETLGSRLYKMALKCLLH